MEIIADQDVLTDATSQFINDIKATNPEVAKALVKAVTDHPSWRSVQLFGSQVNLGHLVTSFTPGVKVIGLTTYRAVAMLVVTITIELAE
ncbi:hypothetical protein IC229_05600 [Spirosoma sp. BT702]|uniref:Uncharacterized protein n=1 Tax=Spirosoma profusum TaxID=2771354 RepID=A0A926XTK4_9BACT|nr:hypothetical protein [Spirosoma profusum]MBD2700099.1 hypothetical protein [Spirosoma profusum]